MNKLPHIKERYKCPDCHEAYSDIGWLIRHVEKAHKENIHPEWTTLQYLFHRRNRTNEPSKCVVCHIPTKWDEDTGKYPRLCDSQACRTTLANRAKENMMKKYGTQHLLDDPEVQRKMLQSRGISGVYKFRDGKTVINYVGTYEKDFLEFYDRELELNPEDISECPLIFKYVLEGKDHFYIPDFYIPNLNLVIEIKDGGDNPNNHPKIQDVDKVKEKLKDQAVINMKSNHYIKITNKEYTEFVELMRVLKDQSLNSYPIDGYLAVLGE